MDYKTTYTYFFKTTQNRLSYILQSQLSIYLEQGRSFTFVDNKILQFYETKLADLKQRWSYNELKPIIDMIGLRNSYYSKHALSRILSNEIKDEFEKLELNINYKYFIAQLAQLKAIDEGYINYRNNRPYVDRCYQTDGIEKITLHKIEDGYNNLDDFHERGKKLKMAEEIGILIQPTDETEEKPNSSDYLEPLEKIILLRVLFKIKRPIQEFMPLSEFARLMYLTSDAFDEEIYNGKIADYGPYRKLGDHIDFSESKVKESIKILIRKLKDKQVHRISNELRKLTL
jgi:hypothetical protein